MNKEKKTGAEEIKEEEQDAAAEETQEEIKEAEAEAPAQESPAQEQAPAAGEEKPSDGTPQSAALAAMNDKYLRLAAEYDNFRKRSQKEKDALYGDIRAGTVSAFLPVYDNLARALAQATQDEAYKKGVEMIMAQFKATMTKLGVSEMDCLGQKFDPAFHNAVMHVEDAEKGENEIVEVFQQGFMLGEKIIRFAMVKVAN